MTARDILMSAGGGVEEKLYVDDVFSTYLFEGSSAAQAINNGIDLLNKGGLVWIKQRNGSDSNRLYSTGSEYPSYALFSNETSGTANDSQGLQSWLSNGFTVGVNWNSANTLASWTFRRATKFFDVVTYTGNGILNASVPHSLGAIPGLIIVKCVSNASDWGVAYLNGGVGSNGIIGLSLNSTSAARDTGNAISGYFSNLMFSPHLIPSANQSAGAFNQNGFTYVAYLFAHDPSAGGLIRCGSFTTDSSGNATISLGWEPQFVLLKPVSSTGDWVIIDSMRGMPVDGADTRLCPNLLNSETAANTLDPTATGFNATGLAASTSYIYMTIRRPNKPPTTGAEVFSVKSGYVSSQNDVSESGLRPHVDAAWWKTRGASASWTQATRLTGSRWLASNSDGAEATNSSIKFNLGQYTYGQNFGFFGQTGETNLNVQYYFRRAPGFFDVVCYAGTGTTTTVAHNLGAVPELIIAKRRDGSTNSDWAIGSKYTSSAFAYDLYLNSTSPQQAGNSWAGTRPTTSVFTVAGAGVVNMSGAAYVAYLFATLPGISKVGSYTGNGGSQTINCGFATGARFVLIKRTNSAGDWYVWDTARGIVSASDPHLSLNSTAAEVTTDDSIGPYASGFIVNQNSATNINANGGQYIFLAIA